MPNDDVLELARWLVSEDDSGVYVPSMAIPLARAVLELSEDRGRLRMANEKLDTRTELAEWRATFPRRTVQEVVEQLAAYQQRAEQAEAERGQYKKWWEDTEESRATWADQCEKAEAALVLVETALREFVARGLQSYDQRAEIARPALAAIEAVFAANLREV
jgi:hypothetical protein